MRTIGAREDMRRAALVSTAALLGALVVATAFYPGLGTNDSFTHIGEFQRGKYADQHPVFLPLWWGFLFYLTGNLASFYIANLIFVLAAQLILIFKYRSSPRIWIVATFQFFPWVLNFSGVAWKDVLLSSLVVFAFALSLLKRRFVWILLFALLVSMALASRQNAFFLVIPLIAAASYRWFAGSPRVFVGAFLLLLPASLIVPVVAHLIADPVRTNGINHQLADDIFVISLENNEALVPGRTMEELLECEGHSQFGLRSNAYIRCLDGWGYYDENSLRKESMIGPWIAAVSSNPFAYLEYRSSKMADFLGLDDFEPRAYFQSGTRYSASFENTTGWEFEPTLLFRLFTVIVEGVAKILPFVFLPFFWLGTSATLSVFSFWRRDFHLGLIFLASSTYILGWFPITIGADFRYINASVWLTTLAIMLKWVCSGVKR